MKIYNTKMLVSVYKILLYNHKSRYQFKTHYYTTLKSGSQYIKILLNNTVKVQIANKLDSE